MSPAFLRSDAALAMTTRAVQGAAMAAAGILVLLRMSATEQGFYFAFISFGLLLQLCDFGLSYASLQAASHRLATDRAADLAALTSRALRINTIVTIAATAAVVLLGGWTFRRADAATSWVAAWVAFIVAVGLNHLTAPAIFIVEGGVSVARAWRLRLAQEVGAGALLLGVLAAGGGLWSLVGYYAVRWALAAWWLRRFDALAPRADVARLPMTHWLRELWPFQWRVGVGAISGFLVFQAFGPILFALRGPAEAGRFALSLSVMNAIVMVTTAWPVSQAAHFGIMLGRRDAERMRHHWTRLLVASTAFAVVSAAAAIGLFAFLATWQPALTARFADPATTAVLVAAAVPHHVIACFAVVLRAERRDPLMVLGLVGGVATVASMTLAARSFDTFAVALAYLGCTVATAIAASRIHRRESGRLVTA